MNLKVAESVSLGHPDKAADAISDALLTAALKKDPNARCAFETLAADTHIILGGEHTSSDELTKEEREKVVADTLKSIYKDYYTYDLTDYIHCQSANLNVATNSFGEDFPAGDQGFMVGFASNETKTYMPLEIYLAKWLTNFMYKSYQEDSSVFRADSKSQVVVDYDAEGKPLHVKSVLISVSHAEGLETDDVRAKATEAFIESFKTFVKDEFGLDVETVLVNPAGQFAIYGPVGDTGLTGRKLVVDNYGSAAPIGGGAYSGKDYSKVDRSGAYFARYVAKNIVAAGLADKCTVYVSYAIGMQEPMSVDLDFAGTEKVAYEKILEAVMKEFDFKPAAITEKLGLKSVDYFNVQELGTYGDNSDTLPWERLDKVEKLKEIL